MAVTSLVAGTLAATEPAVRFNRDIRPILSDNCYHCHGPDANTREAELRLDIQDKAFEPHGKYEAAIIPGDAANSPLYQRLISESESEIMPPVDSHKSLTAEEIDLVRRWIDAGAEWEDHWAFAAPRADEVPTADWGHGAIDAFIAAEHRAQGLQPNPPADKATLVRRISLDLTGLPPAPELVAAFIADESPAAYERLVDSLLADPAYGEHQARFWLDAARYADTHGLHLDNYREIWPYRDWVVDAFNQNMPFDEFTVAQVAGDLLPEATRSQKIATGFIRCNPTTSEGGAIDEEYRAIYVADRASTVSTVFLGLTMGCASCHDHKFDPLSQKDFYSFAAFFNNLEGPVMDGNRYDTDPVVVIPRPEDEAAWDEITAQVKADDEHFAELKKQRKEAFETWVAQEDLPWIEAPFGQHEVYVRQEETSADEADDEAELTADAKKARDDLAKFLEVMEGTYPHATKFTTAKSFAPAANALNPGWHDSFTISVGFQGAQTPVGEDRLMFSRFDGDRGYRVWLIAGPNTQPLLQRYRVEFIHSLATGNLLSVTTLARAKAGPLPWGNLLCSVLYDGSGTARGIDIIHNNVRLDLDPELTIDRLSGDFATTTDMVIEPRVAERSSPVPRVGRVQIHDRLLLPHMLEHMRNIIPLWESMSKPAEERGEKDIPRLQEYYFNVVDPVTLPQRELAQIHLLQKDQIYGRSAVTLVTAEAEGEATAHILNRGLYDQPGEEVTANLPEVFGALPEEEPANRLGLAQWLVAPDNPLTARVIVNRFWQNLFGTGLVETAEDFGIMGTNPSHPELLDWLALEFQANGWNTKALLKQMVMSATYQQDARIDPAELAIDPDNRFLARAPRFRLDAEVLRDQALAVGGLLNRKMGGEPVRPYQPKGIWHAVAYSRSDTAYYFEDEGEALHRRSLYTFWKRTAPPPSMMLFDAPSREACSVRRERTNTPLQALTLMNDPQFIEAARKLAENTLSAQLSSEPAVLIADMYARALGRTAPAEHQAVLEASFAEFENTFSSAPDDATKLLEVGWSPVEASADPARLAALTLVASQIMNLDSFLNRS